MAEFCRVFGRPLTIGWMVLRPDPWMVTGPFGDFDAAASLADRLGPSFRIGYGSPLADNDYIPLEEPGSGACGTDAGPAAPDGPAVLWAEADPAARDLASALLCALGAGAFVGVGTAAGALRAAQERQFDLIVLADLLPDSDGQALAIRIRRPGGQNARARLVTLHNRPAGASADSVTDADLRIPLTARALAGELRAAMGKDAGADGETTA